uniref:Uncharacterized protein n=1 Tax=Ficedula albicollis TaxID=59894 RepID=A0A803VE28_FICAL
SEPACPCSARTDHGSPGLCPTGVTGDHPTPILPWGMELQKSTKVFPHSGQSQGFPYWCLRWSELRLKSFPQSGQRKGLSSGLSPVWLCWWFLRSDLSLKLFPHSMQGFSPVWITWCWSRPEMSLKPFPHSPHS